MFVSIEGECIDFFMCLVLIIDQLRVAKGQSPPSVGPQTSASNKNIQPAASEWEQIPEPVNQQPVVSPNAYDRSEVEAAEEVFGVEDKGQFSRRRTLK